MSMFHRKESCTRNWRVIEDLGMEIHPPNFAYVSILLFSISFHFKVEVDTNPELLKIFGVEQQRVPRTFFIVNDAVREYTAPYSDSNIKHFINHEYLRKNVIGNLTQMISDHQQKNIMNIDEKNMAQLENGKWFLLLTIPEYDMNVIIVLFCYYCFYCM